MESKFDYLTLTIKPEKGSEHNLWDSREHFCT